jgi:mycothiol synthase
MMAKIQSRPATTDADYWTVHRLLIDSVRRAPLGFNWDMRRWEGKRFYDPNPAGDDNWRHKVQLWETERGRLVGVVNPDGPDFANLQVDPNYRHLEPEMLDWAETHIHGPTGDGERNQVHLFVYAYDNYRQELLSARGYEQATYGGVIRRLRFGEQALVQPTLAADYTMRVTNPEEPADCHQIADLLNAAFGRTFHNAAEYQWFTRNAPCFRQYLDLVAVAPDGALAAYVGIPFDDYNRRGVFEPVCTHPDHRQRGLGQALIREGLLRLEKMGAIDVTVETGDMLAANALYNSLGFTKIEKGNYWRKLVTRAIL